MDEVYDRFRRVLEGIEARQRVPEDSGEEPGYSTRSLFQRSDATIPWRWLHDVGDLNARITQGGYGNNKHARPADR